MPALCAGVAQGAACQFSRATPGSPSRASRGQTRCALCCPALLAAALASARKRGALKRLLASLAASSLSVYERALALIAAAGGDVDVLGAAAAAQQLPLDPAAAWRAALGARKRSAAEPSAEALAEFRGRVADDRRRVARKFFKDTLAQQPDGSTQLQADLAALVADVTLNDTGLPSPPAGSTAALVEQWCRLGSWTICDQCHSLRKRPLKPIDLTKVAKPATKKCAACAGSAHVPQPDDIPKRLRNLLPEVLIALRPLDVDVGPYGRTDHGYRVHTAMIRLAWAPVSVEDKIAALPRGGQRKQAKKAFKFLMACAASSYKGFVLRHRAFMGRWPDAAAARRRRPLAFIEERGVECALWPSLYYCTDVCETAERLADIRRQRRAEANGRVDSGCEPVELDGSDAEGASSGRTSIKRSFIHKVLSPVVGYSGDFELLQFVYDLSTWSNLGGAKNAVSGVPLRVVLKGNPISPLYWKVRHNALIDMQRQRGFPFLFATWAPYEWSAPYHSWVLGEMEQMLRSRLHLPGPETLHLAHVLAELFKGWCAGGPARKTTSTRNQWKRHLLSHKHADGTVTVVNWFARLEFQDGRRKAPTQKYHGRGAVHLHGLFFMKNCAHVDLETKLQATTTGLEEPLLGFVAGSQPSRGGSSWPVHAEPSAWDAAAGCLKLFHTAEDAEQGVRAFMPEVMRVLKCHQDVQQSDGRGLLLRYVASYVPKFSDSFAAEWLNDAASAYAVPRRILFDYHPLEPEMWLSLAAKMFPLCFHGGTIVSVVAPWPGMPDKPQYVKLYEAAAWRGHMTLLDFLRRTNNQGHVIRWVKDLRDQTQPDVDLEQFARAFEPAGQKLIAADTVSHFNDRYFGQWLALNMPFQSLGDFLDPHVCELVPDKYRFLACALKAAPGFWRNGPGIRKQMELEACSDAHIDSVLAMIQATSALIDRYLQGDISKQDEATDALPSDIGPAIEGESYLEARRPFNRQQLRLAALVDKAVDQALATEACPDEAAAEELRERAQEHGKVIAGLGPPGTGKTTVVDSCIARAKALNARILLALPTGQLAARMRDRHPDVDVDTCHGLEPQLARCCALATPVALPRQAQLAARGLTQAPSSCIGQSRRPSPCCPSTTWLSLTSSPSFQLRTSTGLLRCGTPPVVFQGWWFWATSGSCPTSTVAMCRVAPIGSQVRPRSTRSTSTRSGGARAQHCRPSLTLCGRPNLTSSCSIPYVGATRPGQATTPPLL